MRTVTNSDANPAEDDAPASESLGFDDVLTRLRKVVAQLETGKLSLEQSLAAYESGVGLARQGHRLLDNVERRVEVLVRGAESDTTEPLDPPTGSDTGDNA